MWAATPPHAAAGSSPCRGTRKTPRQLVVEPNPEATEYTVVSDAPQEDGFEANWNVLRMVFEDAPQKLTRQDILGEWPADFDKPSASNLPNGWPAPSSAASSPWKAAAAKPILIATGSRSGRPSGRKTPL
jgi:hypothetical protein